MSVLNAVERSAGWAGVSRVRWTYGSSSCWVGWSCSVRKQRLLSDCGIWRVFLTFTLMSSLIAWTPWAVLAPQGVFRLGPEPCNSNSYWFECMESGLLYSPVSFRSQLLHGDEQGLICGCSATTSSLKSWWNTSHITPCRRCACWGRFGHSVPIARVTWKQP